MYRNPLKLSSIAIILFLLAAAEIVLSQDRDNNDWSHIPDTETFDVMTWNIEWFGDKNNGPSNLDRQRSNVLLVLQYLRPDLVAVQEIVDEDFFLLLIQELNDGLPDDYQYSGFITKYQQPQQVGFIYNTVTVDSLFSNLIDAEDGQSSYAWAGRFPLQFVYQARVGNVSKIMYSVVVHAKAASGNFDQESYNRRTTASGDIKTYFDTRVTPHSPLIFLGDYNDDVIRSTLGANFDSPYKNFVDSPDYTVVSQTLSERGEESWKRENRRGSMLDHITVNHHLHDYWLQGSEMVFVPDFINNFSTTTSDHRPVYARFDLSGELGATSARDPDSGFERPERTKLNANYPNPFNSSTTIPFTLAEAETVTITVYNLLGQEVARPVSHRQYESGNHSIRFNGSDLAGGLYFYRMITGSDVTGTRKMLLVK